MNIIKKKVDAYLSNFKKKKLLNLRKKEKLNFYK